MHVNWKPRLTYGFNKAVACSPSVMLLHITGLQAWHVYHRLLNVDTSLYRMEQVAADDDSSSSLQSSLTFEAQANTAYFIFLLGYSGSNCGKTNMLIKEFSQTGKPHFVCIYPCLNLMTLMYALISAWVEAVIALAAVHCLH